MKRTNPPKNGNRSEPERSEAVNNTVGPLRRTKPPKNYEQPEVNGARKSFTIDEDWPGKEHTGYYNYRPSGMPPGSFIKCEKSQQGYLEMTKCYIKRERGECECDIAFTVFNVKIRPA